MRLAGLLLVGASVFFAGLAVGQKSKPLRMTQYNQPAAITQGQWLALNASVDSLMQSLPYDSMHTGAPNFWFEPKTGMVRATASVSSETLTKKETGKVMEHLSRKAEFAFALAKLYFKDISEDKFELDYVDFELGMIRAESGRDILEKSTFARYKNGKLVLR